MSEFLIYESDRFIIEKLPHGEYFQLMEKATGEVLLWSKHTDVLCAVLDMLVTFDCIIVHNDCSQEPPVKSVKLRRRHIP